MSYASDHEDMLAGTRISVAEPRDYFTLLKPRVMSLVVLTALAGLLIAPGHMNPVLGFTSLLAIAIGAGASGALNMWYDADIDAVMTRTRTRPVPSGRITPGEALSFGLILGLAANWLAAALLAFTIFFYAVIYTMWLKRSTPQNIVIGGAAGALPPIVAYAAATGTVTLAPVVLFAIIFIWTPPHFWALALVKSAEYERAGIPMMPNVKGESRTRTEILIYSILLAPLGVAPWLLGFASSVYGGAAIAGGIAMLAGAVRVYRVRTGPEAHRVAMQLFAVSIFYLFALFGILVIENSTSLLARLIG